MNPDFHKLWTAQAVSAFGARITREGLPIMAVVSLGAGAALLIASLGFLIPSLIGLASPSRNGRPAD
jgi:hypothetical protein